MWPFICSFAAEGIGAAHTRAPLASFDGRPDASLGSVRGDRQSKLCFFRRRGSPRPNEPANLSVSPPINIFLFWLASRPPYFHECFFGLVGLISPLSFGAHYCAALLFMLCCFALAMAGAWHHDCASLLYSVSPVRSRSGARSSRPKKSSGGSSRATHRCLTAWPVCGLVYHCRDFRGRLVMHRNLSYAWGSLATCDRNLREAYPANAAQGSLTPRLKWLEILLVKPLPANTAEKGAIVSTAQLKPHSSEPSFCIESVALGVSLNAVARSLTCCGTNEIAL